MRGRGGRLPRALAGLLVAAASGPAAAQTQDFSKVEIRVEKVAGSVYMLTGLGGNVGISVGPDGVVLVDDQFAPLVPRIRDAIRGITQQPVRFVLNTHWHFDHSGGNAPFAAEATIIAHENARRRMRDGDPKEVAGHPVLPAAPEALPVISFDRSLTVHLNGEDVRALHYPRGHTDGDVVVHFTRSGVVHMGDDFVTLGFPFIDVASGGSLLGLIENLDAVLAVLPDDVKVIPGHGGVSTKADVRRFADMLRDCVERVRAARREGRTLAEMQQQGVLAEYDALGLGFVPTREFIALIDAELERAGERRAAR
jgi:glyoxylase-like metal-dependent hydrolase (beta-lactamase superfamily II)